MVTSITSKATNIEVRHQNIDPYFHTSLGVSYLKISWAIAENLDPSTVSKEFAERLTKPLM